jgi:tetrahydromethanopterin S-methyltransferase subunit B
MPIDFEFIQYVQDSMHTLIAILPYWQSLPGRETAEVCTTYTEYHEGVWYVINLCVNLLTNATGS